jgi:DnaA-homolog protein
MNQLLLDISPRPRPTFENFAAGENAEAVAAMRAATGADSRERLFYIWGDAGAGKTHLLRALAEPSGAYVNCRESVPDFTQLVGAHVLAVDEVECLDEASQIALFHHYNERRARGSILAAASRGAPQTLAIKPELSSRLAWGLVFRLRPLSDDEKLAALVHHARERGFALAPEVSRYLLSHCGRDLPSLMALVERLDRYSLRTHRAITVPLLKDVLAGAA